MSSIKRPRNWLCVVAFAAAFWITLRVMAATVPLPAATPPEPTASERAVSGTEVLDPALELMIARFASAARASER